MLGTDNQEQFASSSSPTGNYDDDWSNHDDDDDFSNDDNDENDDDDDYDDYDGNHNANPTQARAGCAQVRGRLH